MRRRNSDSVFNRLLSYCEKEEVFAAVVVIKLVANRYLVAKLIFTKSARRSKLYSLVYRFALGLCGINKFFIVLGIKKCLFYSLGR